MSTHAKLKDNPRGWVERETGLPFITMIKSGLDQQTQMSLLAKVKGSPRVWVSGELGRERNWIAIY